MIPEDGLSSFIESCWRRGDCPKTVMSFCLGCRQGFTLQEKTSGGEVVVLQDCACGKRWSALKDVAP